MSVGYFYTEVLVFHHIFQLRDSPISVIDGSLLLMAFAIEFKFFWASIAMAATA